MVLPSVLEKSYIRLLLCFAKTRIISILMGTKIWIWWDIQEKNDHGCNVWCISFQSNFCHQGTVVLSFLGQDFWRTVSTNLLSSFRWKPNSNYDLWSFKFYHMPVIQAVLVPSSEKSWTGVHEKIKIRACSAGLKPAGWLVSPLTESLFMSYQNSIFLSQ